MIANATRARPTLIAIGSLGTLALFASLAGATEIFSSVNVRVALVVATWGALGLLLAYLFLPRFDLPHRQLRRVPGAHAVALTIDDGPHPESTPAILDALRASDVRATFFLVGAGVERWPDLARRIVGEGHALGNHTMRHRLLPFRTGAQLADEIAGCQRVLASFARDGVRWFRPPNGLKPIGLHHLLARHSLRLVAWHGSIRDTDGPGVPVIVERALALAKSGRILLLHDNPTCRGQTAAALPAIVAGYRARGFYFVTLDDC